MISMMTTTAIHLMSGMPRVTLKTLVLHLSLILLTIRPLLTAMRWCLLLLPPIGQ